MIQSNPTHHDKPTLPHLPQSRTHHLRLPIHRRRRHPTIPISTHLLRRTLKPIIVPLIPSRRLTTTIPLLRERWALVPLLFINISAPKLTGTVQAPIARRSLDAHSGLSVVGVGARRGDTGGVVIVAVCAAVEMLLLGSNAAAFIFVRIFEFPRLRHDKLAHGVGGVFLEIPRLDPAHVLEFGKVAVLFHGEDGGDEVAVRGVGFVPALEAEVGLLEPVEVLFHFFGIHGVDGAVVAVVAFDDEAEDVLVHAHRFAVVARAGVESGEELGHLETLGVEGPPDAAEVVAYIFAELDGAGAVVFVRVGGLDVEATDGDDGGGGPFLLNFAGGPEEFEEPLSFWSA